MENYLNLVDADPGAAKGVPQRGPPKMCKDAQRVYDSFRDVYNTCSYEEKMYINKRVADFLVKLSPFDAKNLVTISKAKDLGMEWPSKKKDSEAGANLNEADQPGFIRKTANAVGAMFGINSTPTKLKKSKASSRKTEESSAAGAATADDAVKAEAKASSAGARKAQTRAHWRYALSSGDGSIDPPEDKVQDFVGKFDGIEKYYDVREVERNEAMDKYMISHHQNLCKGFYPITIAQKHVGALTAFKQTETYAAYKEIIEKSYETPYDWSVYTAHQEIRIFRMFEMAGILKINEDGDPVVKTFDPLA